MKSWFKMAAVSGNASIDIYDEIGGFGLNAKIFKAQLDALGKVTSLKLRINSPGGEIIDGNVIYNLIRENPASKTVCIDGIAASIASVIAMAGDIIQMPQNAFLMIHNPYLYTVGNADQLRADAELLDKWKEGAITCYLRDGKCKLNRNELAEMMDGKNGADATWLTADEAIECGLADEILEPLQMKNSIVPGKLKIPEYVMKVLTQDKKIFSFLNSNNSGVPDPKMPYENEHAARIRDPGDFKDNSFRRKNIADGIDIIIGKLKNGDDKMVTQAYRFKIDKFTADEAKKWLKDHDIKYISFEPAKKKSENIFTKGNNMKKCPKCGMEIAEEAVFCSHCGASAKMQTIDPAVKAAHDREVAEASQAAMAAENSRVSNILALCKKAKVADEERDRFIADKTPLDQVRERLFDKLIGGFQPLRPDPAMAGHGIAVGADESDKFVKGAVMAICGINHLKTTNDEDGRATKKEMETAIKSEAPKGMHQIVQACLLRKGMNPMAVFNLTGHELADYAFQLAVEARTNYGSGARMDQGQSTSEFSYILADVQNKFLRQGYEEAPVTFPIWTNEIEVKDFKPNHLVKISSFSDIDDIPEGMGFKEGRFSDKEERVQVDTKGKKMVLTRKAIINDDTAALTRVPAAIMASVRRRQNKDCYDLLTSNSLSGPTMVESVGGSSEYLFDSSNHANIASTAMPSIASIGVSDVALMNMKLPKPDNVSKPIFSNLEGKFLIAGTVNKILINQILKSQYDVSTTTYQATYGVENPYNGRIIPVFDAYLNYLLSTAVYSKPNAWYLTTDPRQMGHFTIAYLAGQRVPYLRSQPSFVGQPLGILWDIFMEWGWGVEDFRGIVYNAGS